MIILILNKGYDECYLCLYCLYNFFGIFVHNFTILCNNLYSNSNMFWLSRIPHIYNI